VSARSTGWIQNEIARRIVGTAIVQILQEQWLSRHTVGERISAAPELCSDEAVGVRNADRLAAPLAQQRSNRPILNGPNSKLCSKSKLCVV
jgi:hypothetical protein